jgi:hypothetical protein
VSLHSKIISDFFSQCIPSTLRKEIINSFQSACVPPIENANKVFWSNWMSPKQATELYANIVSNFANNMIAAVLDSRIEYVILCQGHLLFLYLWKQNVNLYNDLSIIKELMSQTPDQIKTYPL